ncbi:MAG: tetratricopeptide repeat protein [Bacteroidia bacterium]
MKPSQLKILFSVVAVLLFVLLFCAPRFSDEGKPKSIDLNSKKSEFNINQTVDIYYEMTKKSLDADLLNQLEVFSIKSKESNNFFDSIATFWDKLKRPDFAAYSLEEKAKQLNQSDLWNLAGNRYYYSIQFVKDESEHPVLYASAARCFKKSFELDKLNIDAKIMYASCMVEGSGDPMSGIALLREVEKTDSNNLKLQLTFAYLSINSGQKDKAIRRFQKALEIDSTYIEAYLHLADLYEQSNEIENTVLMLEKYEERTGDPTAKIEIAKYIKQLKKNINQ